MVGRGSSSNTEPLVAVVRTVSGVAVEKVILQV